MSLSFAPCKLMFDRCLRTRLDMLGLAKVVVQVLENLHQQMAHHDQHGSFWELVGEQPVWACNWRHGSHWVPAHVQDLLAPLLYLIQLKNGKLWRRHVDQLRARNSALLCGLSEQECRIAEDGESQEGIMGPEHSTPAGVWGSADTVGNQAWNTCRHGTGATDYGSRRSATRCCSTGYWQDNVDPSNGSMLTCMPNIKAKNGGDVVHVVVIMHSKCSVCHSPCIHHVCCAVSYISILLGSLEGSSGVAKLRT